MVSVVWIVVFRRYGGSVYDVRELLDSTVKLMDGNPLGDAGCPIIGKAEKSLLRKQIKLLSGNYYAIMVF